MFFTLSPRNVLFPPVFQLETRFPPQAWLPTEGYFFFSAELGLSVRVSHLLFFPLLINFFCCATCPCFLCREPIAFEVVFGPGRPLKPREASFVNFGGWRSIFALAALVPYAVSYLGPFQPLVGDFVASFARKEDPDSFAVPLERHETSNWTLSGLTVFLTCPNSPFPEVITRSCFPPARELFSSSFPFFPFYFPPIRKGFFPHGE